MHFIKKGRFKANGLWLKCSTAQNGLTLYTESSQTFKND